LEDTLYKLRRILKFSQEIDWEIKHQRKHLVSINSEVQESKQYMSEGNIEIVEATSKQKVSTKTICWILIIVFIVVIGLVTFLVIYLR
jgi:predicted anti-sigma-YlaC factor YlaD